MMTKINIEGIGRAQEAIARFEAALDELQKAITDLQYSGINITIDVKADKE